MQNNKLRSEKGSIAVYAIATILSFLMILGGIFFTSSIIRKNQLRTLLKIKDVYVQDVGRVDEIAEEIKQKNVVDIATVTSTDHDTLKARDAHGNIVTVPKGFKVVEGTAGEEITVQNGVVIEDKDGNQFVWIPVGIVIKDDGSKSNEIKLGRYTFAGASSTEPAPGTPKLEQEAYIKNADGSYTNNYENEVTINSYYKELKDPREGNSSDGTEALNATAKKLAGFVDSVAKNGGYYLARYEASYGGGYEPTGSDDKAKYGKAKPLSQPSTVNSTSSMTYDTLGKLWNFITQLNASRVCKNMYTEVDNVGVESDLVNSYAWDTAIVYIQEMGHTNYSNKTDGNGTLKDTGEINASTSKPNDEVCKINDMGSNLYEWSTEYSTCVATGGANPCVYRGSIYYNSNSYTAYRNYDIATDSFYGIGFRPLLYVK